MQTEVDSAVPKSQPMDLTTRTEFDSMGKVNVAQKRVSFAQ